MTTETTWKSWERAKSWTKSRDYLLGSLFSTILTALTDPKDDKALRIKTNPAYAEKTKWKGRNQVTTTYRSRI